MIHFFFKDVRFAKSELELLYRHFQRQLAVSEASTGFFINRPGFLRVFSKFVPWWKDNSNLLEKSWHHLSEENKGGIEVKVFYCCLISPFERCFICWFCESH